MLHPGLSTTSCLVTIGDIVETHRVTELVCMCTGL